MYNKNGRIGIYTPAERAAIIQKFNAKRARRVWNKKIRYNCRKNLTDWRMRVKGRFVKRSVEVPGSPPPSPAEEEETREVRIRAKAASRSNSPPTLGSPSPTVNEDEEPPPDEKCLMWTMRRRDSNRWRICRIAELEGKLLHSTWLLVGRIQEEYNEFFYCWQCNNRLGQKL